MAFIKNKLTSDPLFTHNFHIVCIVQGTFQFART